jgi:hypothetical protein
MGSSRGIKAWQRFPPVLKTHHVWPGAVAAKRGILRYSRLYTSIERSMPGHTHTRRQDTNHLENE